MTVHRRNLRGVLPLFLIALFVLAGCSLASEPEPAGPIESGPLPGEAAPENLPIALPRAGNGEVTYAARCAGCHGPEGAGDGQFAAQLAEQGAVLPDFTDPAYADQQTPQDWYEIITLGTIMQGGLMPPWRETLTDSERWDVTYYLYSLSMTSDHLDQGEALFAANCAECHAEGGPAADVLSDITYIAEFSPAQIRNVLTSGDSHDFTSLSAEELFAVTRYARTFGYDATLPDEAVAEEIAGEDTGGGEEEPPAEEPAEEVPAEGEEATGVSVVTGQVVSASGEPVGGGTEVTLTGVSVDETGAFTPFLERTITTSENGEFLFDELPADQTNAAYVVEANYQGVTFTNGAMIRQGQTELTLPITVYEVTSDASVLRVDSAHLVIREHPEALIVLQVMVYSNNSDQVYLSDELVRGGQRGSVAISLPPDAEGVAFEEGTLGGRFIEVGDKIYDTQQVSPGDSSHAIIVQYFLPFDGAREIDIPLPHGANQITVLTQGESEIDSDQLNPAGTQNIEGDVYTQYVGQGLGPGDTLHLTIGAAGFAANLGDWALPALVGFGTLLLVGGGVYWIANRRAAGGDLSDALDELSTEQETLIRQIAELDNAYDAGKINRLDYEAQRAELKAALADELQDEE